MVFNPRNAGPVLHPEMSRQFGKGFELRTIAHPLEQQVAQVEAEIKCGVSVVSGFKVNQRQTVPGQQDVLGTEVGQDDAAGCREILRDQSVQRFFGFRS